MTRHTKRLARNPDFAISMSSIWKYKEYEIERNNGKNFVQYEKYTKLFRKLCKLYKNDERVNMELCLYGMEHCSNLSQWVSIWNMRKEKKYITRLHRFVNDLYLSCVEIDQPSAYSFDNLFTHKKSEEIVLFEYDMNGNMWMSSMIKNYVLENIDVLLSFMKYHYDDIERLKRIVNDIYHSSGFESKSPGIVSENTKLTYVYEHLIEMLDDAILDSVWQSVEFIVSNMSEN